MELFKNVSGEGFRKEKIYFTSDGRTVLLRYHNTLLSITLLQRSAQPCDAKNLVGCHPLNLGAKLNQPSFQILIKKTNYQAPDNININTPFARVVYGMIVP